MGAPATVICRTDTDQTHVNTLCVCYCVGVLLQKSKTGVLKAGISGEDVKHIHEHLKRFNFDLELSKSSNNQISDSADVTNDHWGSFTSRAIRMFAAHPQVKQEAESIISVEGTVLTEAILAKMTQWCSQGTASPRNYWEFKQLSVSDGVAQKVDAYGNDLGNGSQSAWHHHIHQIQQDLGVTGFGVHDDDLCEIGKACKPDGTWWVAPVTPRVKHFRIEDSPVQLDKGLRDLNHLIARFQRQAAWLWRMKTDGTSLPDDTPGSPTHYGGSVTGIMDQATAKVLREWVNANLHMVLNKFELKDLHWPPDGGSAITVDNSSRSAKLRSDAYDAWYAAAVEIHDLGATIEGSYSSSPRPWTTGKQSPRPGQQSGNSCYSWHYSALGVDLGERLAAADGTISMKHGWRYILEPDGNEFRIWCWVDPQPAAPATASDDKLDSLRQYRNRNIRTGHVIDGHEILKVGDPTDPSPLLHIHTDYSTLTAAKTGWYVNVTAILVKHGLVRIAAHRDAATNPKGWEWWHYQFSPATPTWLTDDFTFGDYLQMIGAHEYRLRNVSDGWPAHEDIDHAPG